jgi:hypothetical protein
MFVPLFGTRSLGLTARSRRQRWSAILFESFTRTLAMYQAIHTYTELRQQIHDDLRIQHPEWVKPNGECPMCDSYELRLTEMLGALTRTGIQRYAN